MAQFDVYRTSGAGLYSLLLDVQSDSLERIESRIVVPLVARRKLDPRELIGRLNPSATIAGTEYLLIVQELAAVPKTVLGARVVSLATQRADIIAAIDLLITGS